ncbi:hypothetical protein [Anatilimnocola floriformis]|uniref:hypothetical protein n=1 Tax=Anatilimnocola floriformis TaxID=2948575 RepID=UPI0020C54AA5|nr:hypothetical protein [Anatilimnocola floriformis]
MAISNRQKNLLTIAGLAIVVAAMISATFMLADHSEQHKVHHVHNETRLSNGRPQHEWEASAAMWQKLLEDAKAANNAQLIEECSQKIAEAERNIARLKN